MNLRRKSQKKIDGVAPKNSIEPMLEGKEVVITGTIPKMTRAEAHRQLREMGAIPTERITTTTDYLIAGFGLGQTKINKAKAYGIQIINASEIF